MCSSDLRDRARTVRGRAAERSSDGLTLDEMPVQAYVPDRLTSWPVAKWLAATNDRREDCRREFAREFAGANLCDAGTGVALLWDASSELSEVRPSAPVADSRQQAPSVAFWPPPGRNSSPQLAALGRRHLRTCCLLAAIAAHSCARGISWLDRHNLFLRALHFNRTILQ